MKRNWLLYLVIFSLALNLGTIGTLAYLRYQDHAPAASRDAQPPLPMRALWGTLQLEDSQRQVLRGLFPEHRRQVRQLQGDLARKRLELFELMKDDSSWDAIQVKIREISALQGNLEEEMVRFLLAFKKHLKPEQHAAFMDLVQTRLGRALGAPGRSCGPVGPMGPPPGRGRGPGGGPPRECPD